MKKRKNIKENTITTTVPPGIPLRVITSLIKLLMEGEIIRADYYQLNKRKNKN